MKETIERNNRFYTNEKGEIKTENEQLKEWLVIANKENERLNNIIDKAIKYIRKLEFESKELYDISEIARLELLEILQGSDKE